VPADRETAHHPVVCGWAGRLREDQRGIMTPWILAGVLILLGFGLFTWQLWTVSNKWQALSNRANSAAIAGASGIDENAFRSQGRLVLEPARAEALAWRNLRAQQPDPALSATQVTATPAALTVRLTGKMTVFGAYRITIPLTATATPMRGAP
jgi:hypothetical protein